MKKWFFVPILLVIVLGAGGFFFSSSQQKLKGVTSYESCANAGFAIMDSYPPRCRTSDGRTFTQDIGNELRFHDEILVEHPRPNQKIDSPLAIKGRARGLWFFEAQFSAELFDANNKSLGVAIITAEGDWMTEDFVSFTGELSFEKPTTEKGILKLRNANPSGLPEKQKELIMPIYFTSLSSEKEK